MSFSRHAKEIKIINEVTVLSEISEMVWFERLAMKLILQMNLIDITNSTNGVKGVGLNLIRGYAKSLTNEQSGNNVALSWSTS